MSRTTNNAVQRRRSCRRATAAGALSVLALAAVPLAARASSSSSEDSTQFSVITGGLTFTPAPAMPNLSSVHLEGAAQSTHTTMTDFGVTDATGSDAGWNVTVEGASGPSKSAVFAQYCPRAACGADPEGYVAGGATLASDSLTLDSSGASLVAEGGSGAAPTLECSSACDVDSATAVKIASAAEKAGLGSWRTSGWSPTSLTLATPSTLKPLPNEEVYRVDLLWTLGSGP